MDGRIDGLSMIHGITGNTVKEHPSLEPNPALVDKIEEHQPFMKKIFETIQKMPPQTSISGPIVKSQEDRIMSQPPPPKYKSAATNMTATVKGEEGGVSPDRRTAIQNMRRPKGEDPLKGKRPLVGDRAAWGNHGSPKKLTSRMSTLDELTEEDESTQGGTDNSEVGDSPIAQWNKFYADAMPTDNKPSKVKFAPDDELNAVREFEPSEDVEEEEYSQKDTKEPEESIKESIRQTPEVEKNTAANKKLTKPETSDTE